MSILKLILSLALIILPFVVAIILWINCGVVVGLIAMVIDLIYIKFFADKVLNYINKENK